MSTSNEYDFIRIVEVDNTGLKTRRWMIENKKTGTVLGHIGWYGGWRQYIVQFSQKCIFSAGCLDDIQKFVAQANADHKTKRKKAKAVVAQ